MSLVFANNAASTLAVTATLSDTVITVATGEGARFPSPGVGDSFILTVQSALLFEIMECTARTGDNLTVVRAREGTAAQTWTLGSTATMRVTAGTMAALEQRARALASFAPINGPISLAADPAGPTEAVRESYLAGRETAIRTDLGADIISRGRLVGEVVDFAGPRLPSRFLWCSGQEVSRVTYSELFNAITDVLTVTTVAGSANVTVTAGGSGILNSGVPISLNGIFAPGTTLVSVPLPSVITLSTPASMSLSGQQLRVCPHGAGNDINTFNVPDRRGLVPLGRDAMGGAPTTNRVTSAGSFVDGYRLGFVGGSQFLQIHAHGLSQTPHGHGASDNLQFFLPGGTAQLIIGPVVATFSGPGVGNLQDGGGIPCGKSGGVSVAANFANVSCDTAGAGATQNIQPSAVTHFIIFSNVP